MENANSKTEEIQQANDAKPFKTFNSQSELDSFLKNREERLKAKLETDIKSKLEKEAELTAEQKLMEKVKALEDEKRLVLIDKNKTKAEREFMSKGLDKGNYAEILDFIVSDDEENTLQKARKLIDFIEVNSKNIADEKIKKAMKDIKKPENSEMKAQNLNEVIAKRLGKSRSATYKAAAETLKKYL
mgnify:CR=1 FL=1